MKRIFNTDGKRVCDLSDDRRSAYIVRHGIVTVLQVRGGRLEVRTASRDSRHHS